MAADLAEAEVVAAAVNLDSAEAAVQTNRSRNPRSSNKAAHRRYRYGPHRLLCLR